ERVHPESFVLFDARDVQVVVADDHARVSVRELRMSRSGKQEYRRRREEGGEVLPHRLFLIGFGREHRSVLRIVTDFTCGIQARRRTLSWPFAAQVPRRETRYATRSAISCSVSFSRYDGINVSTKPCSRRSAF